MRRRLLAGLLAAGLATAAAARAQAPAAPPGPPPTSSPAAAPAQAPAAPPGPTPTSTPAAPPGPTPTSTPAAARAQAPAAPPGPTPTSTPAAAPGPTPTAAATPAAPPTPTPTQSPPAADQRVTVHLRGVPSGLSAQVQRGDATPTPMADPGTGVLTAELYGPPSRFLQLRVLLAAPNRASHAAYDGLVVLTDSAHETLAFQVQDGRALRLPVAPSARTEVALDQRATWWVTFGWGALALAWVGLVGGLWAIRSR